MEKMTRKIWGQLTLGPVRHDMAADAAAYSYLRVGDTHLQHVRVPGELDTLLRNGAVCTLYVATVMQPTPFFFRSPTHFVYAAEIDGKRHAAIESTIRYWRSMKWLSVALQLGIGTLTLIMYVGILFWIGALRMSWVDLPVSEMRKELA